MFYFFSQQQTPENASYHRGLLFEVVLREFLRTAGYSMELRRRKINSLEYDLSGIHAIDNRPVLGEAKAHEDTISGQDVSAFVGKFAAQFYKDNRILPLFLSTSPLSPDAADYLRDLNSTSPFKLTAISGDELEQRVRAALGLPTAEQIEAALTEVIPGVTQQHLLHTDIGTFVVAIGSSRGQGFSDRIAIFDKRGNAVTEKRFYDSIRSAIGALQELEPAAPAPTNSQLFGNRTRDIPRGLITASDWLDYRRPADARFFVGRSKAIADAHEAIESRGAEGAVIEIKARSGVGKSSLLAVLAAAWTKEGSTVELHDSRDVHSASDVLGLVSRLAGERLLRFEDVPEALKSLTRQLRVQQRRGYFIVDQFESTFNNKEVFSAYEFVALAIARSPVAVTMMYARKDDLLTTYDDSAVSLDRLRQISHPIPLEDFSSPEATELLKRIAAAESVRLSNTLLPPVLEFAKGFPWLLKRTMAHVYKLLKDGISQNELVTAGLQLQDLFEEELAGLDEIEQGYLRRLAAILPATYQNLLRRYEGDPYLPRVLEKLTERRLLRLSAGTYDTYSDVFKEFLLYQRLPEGTHAYMLKAGPVPVMSTFRALGGSNEIQPEELRKTIQKTIGATYNVLRDMRFVGLVERTATDWVVPAVVRSYEHQGRLGEYLRQSFLKNQCVTDFLAMLERDASMSVGDVANFLRDEFPFVEAKAHVWNGYANTFVTWLKVLRFITFLSTDRITMETKERSEIVKTIGNLDIRGRGLRRVDDPFVPWRELIVYERTLSDIAAGSGSMASLRKSERDAAQDLLKIGAVRRERDGALKAMWSIADLRLWAQRLVMREEYSEFWSRLNAGESYDTAAEAIAGLSRLSPMTRVQLAQKMANWGRQFGMIRVKRVASAVEAEPKPADEQMSFSWNPAH